MDAKPNVREINETDAVDPIPENCPSFISCSAPLCPLDPDIHLRLWFTDDPICQSQKYCKRRWIRKQRSIVRRRTKTWFENHPITYQRLYDASRPKQLSDEQRTQLRERMKQIRARRQKFSSCSLSSTG